MKIKLSSLEFYTNPNLALKEDLTGVLFILHHHNTLHKTVVFPIHDQKVDMKKSSWIPINYNTEILKDKHVKSSLH